MPPATRSRPNRQPKNGAIRTSMSWLDTISWLPGQSAGQATSPP